LSALIEEWSEYFGSPARPFLVVMSTTPFAAREP